MTAPTTTRRGGGGTDRLAGRRERDDDDDEPMTGAEVGMQERSGEAMTTDEADRLLAWVIDHPIHTQNEKRNSIVIFNIFLDKIDFPLRHPHTIDISRYPLSHLPYANPPLNNPVAGE